MGRKGSKNKMENSICSVVSEILMDKPKTFTIYTGEEYCHDALLDMRHMVYFNEDLIFSLNK